jgi:molybdate transport system ATP-binding protein
MAYVPQHSAVFPHLTVRQNLIFPAAVRTHGFTRALSTSNRQAIDDAIAIFALRPLLDRSTALLSGGELKRVSLARALATPGIRLLLLDEAFTGLDRSLRDTLISEMKLWLASRNIPTLSVTHDVEEALLLNAEVVRIDRGKVIAQGPVVEALRSERMQMLHTLQLGEW